MTRFKATFLSLFLALGMILGTTTAYAAETRSGTEVWHLGEATVGSFVVENDNLTPVKTIGDDGKLFIWTQFSRADSSMLKKDKESKCIGILAVSIIHLDHTEKQI